MLFVGFGRFAQVVSQPLLSKGIDISIIETDVEMIRAAGNFGFKVYYGDGTRLDVLRASGAANAEAILVCVDKPEVADRIVELVKSEFPHPKLFVRAFDRGHVLRLISAGVDYQIRETFESALVFGRQVLVDLGVEESDADEAILDTRRRDEQRLEMQIAGGLRQGLSLMRGNIATTQPAPLVVPREKAKALNEEAAEAIGDKPRTRAGGSPAERWGEVCNAEAQPYRAHLPRGYRRAGPGRRPALPFRAAGRPLSQKPV